MAVAVWQVVAGTCLCGAAGFGTYTYYTGGSPPTTTIATDTPGTVPAPPATTVTSPVLGEPVVDDASRIAAELPIYPGHVQLDGQDALGYVDLLRRFIPGTSWGFVVVDQVLKCSMSEGLLAARAYVGPDDRSATTVVVLSNRKLQGLDQVLVDCATRKVHEAFGGPAGGFSPCAEAYDYDVRYQDQSVDRYFVFVASSAKSYCQSVKAWHVQLHVQQGAIINDIWSAGL